MIHIIFPIQACVGEKEAGRVLNAKEDNEYNQLWFKSKIKTYPNMV